MYLHLTVETTRVNVPAKALWIAAPLSEKQTVQSVLFPEGICYRKDIGFFAPVTNELEAIVFNSLLELAEHEEDYKVLDGGASCIILNRTGPIATHSHRKIRPAQLRPTGIPYLREHLVAGLYFSI